MTRRKGTKTMTSTTESTTATTTTSTTGAQSAPAAPKAATSTKVATTPKAAPKGKKGGRGQNNPVTKAMVAAKVLPPASKESKKASKPTTKKTAKTSTKKAGKTATVPREFSKKQIVLDLLRRKDGATMADIAKATDWQDHSIRGFISGNVSKKMGLAVESTKNESGERTYRITGK
jgi:hypothetical protein